MCEFLFTKGFNELAGSRKLPGWSCFKWLQLFHQLTWFRKICPSYYYNENDCLLALPLKKAQSQWMTALHNVLKYVQVSVVPGKAFFLPSNTFLKFGMLLCMCSLQGYCILFMQRTTNKLTSNYFSNVVWKLRIYHL